MSGKTILESESPEKSMVFCEALVICSSTRYSNPKMVEILFWKMLSTFEDVGIFESKIDDFLEDRNVRIEIIWKIVYSDGSNDNYESNLIRRICGLLYVSDKDNGIIKNKVLNSIL